MRALFGRRPVWAPFLVAAVAGAAVVVLAFASLGSYKRAADTTTVSAQTYASVAGIYTSILSAETGERGYIITGDEQFLDSYHQAVEQVEAQLAVLATQVRGNTEEERLYAELQALVDARLSRLAAVIEIRRSGDAAGAASMVATGDGKAQTDAIAANLGRIVVVEGEQHEAARTTAADRAWQTRVAIGVLAVLAAALLFWVFRSLRRENREEALRASNQAKDEFLGMVSHELRTPITAVMGHARLLIRNGDRLSEEDRLASLHDIENEGERLQRVVENMLTLSRMERGERVDREPVLVQRIIQRAVARHQSRFPARQVEVDMPGDLPPALGHESHVEQVLNNLLSNAEKYGDRGAPITVRARSLGGLLEVAVMDRGPGIPAAQRESIFDAFVRLEGAARRADGAGLGLPVCRRVLEAMGGEIHVSDREGGGAVFSFTLQGIAVGETEDAYEGTAHPAGTGAAH
ncbi:MAG: CHASE3 domain-containing protein [Dehalococcoidia bacterium]|nr:CHASE3 domain-containing protein [Dehalococcoidia bacterium]